MVGKLAVKLNPASGTVISAARRDVSREAAFPISPFGFGQLLYERFDSNNVAAYVQSYVKINADWALNELGKPAMPPASAVPYNTASPTNFTVRYTNSWFAGEAIMDAPASEEVPFAVTTRCRVLQLADASLILKLPFTTSPPTHGLRRRGFACRSTSSRRSSASGGSARSLIQ
ncbi:MAG: hypothetical protein V9H26_22615 [Verrucomicrobiota bacterium]